MKAKHCVFATTLTALLCVGPSAGGDVPFGPYHLPEDALGPPLTLTMAGPKTPEEALRFLKAARKKKTKVLIHLTGGRQRHQNADKSFSVEKFAALLERFQGVDFAPFVKDGTLLGHMLFDEPHDPTNWNGQPVPFTQIKAVAAVSKRLWPSLPTGIGSPPRYLSGGAPWKSLDFASAQYHAKRGDFKDWLHEEVALAKKSNLKLVLSLNVLHGGDARRRDQADVARTTAALRHVVRARTNGDGTVDVEMGCRLLCAAGNPEGAASDCQCRTDKVTTLATARGV